METQAEGGHTWAIPRDDLFIIEKQPDGNWKGWTQKYGKQIEIRDVGPETVLQLLMTHDGK